jgi:hypothetical protein
MTGARRAARIGLLLGFAAGVAACADDPEPVRPWQEEVIYEDEGPPPPPRRSDRYDDEDEDRPPRSGGSGHYERRARERRSAGAIYAPRRGVYCDESVRACYTAKGGHVGQTQEQFGSEAGRRLEQRIDAGDRGERGIYRPAGGVVCDRQSEVCYDRDGASLAQTRREFGHGAADDLAERVDRPRSGPGRRGGVIYSPRQGVSCDELVAACYVADEAHAGHTKREFGSEAVRGLERRVDGGRDRRDGIYRIEGGGVCDRESEVCYDRRGASAPLTRREFGREAAVRLAERLE